MESLIREWSPYQAAIFEAVSDSTQSLIIEAVAGSGKTTTIVEAIRHVPANQSVAFLAFNKSIAEELKKRVTSPNAKCMTLHAAGFAAWRKHVFPEDPRLDSGKTRELVKKLEDSERWLWKGDVHKLLGLAKQAGIVPRGAAAYFKGLVDDDEEVWRDIIDFYGLDLDPDGSPFDVENEDVIEERINLVRKVLRMSIESAHEVIDYDDMLYMPVVGGAAFDKYDVVFLDEAQDVNGIQVEMVDRMRKASSRIVAVGDRHQAIYGFRGALHNSMDEIAERFHCEPLPLSVSYRCPVSVVEQARQWVPYIEPFEDALLGLVEACPSWKLRDFKPGDAVLCRLSRPTVELAFLLIRNKIPARVVGRDIGQGLVKLVDKMKASDVPDLIRKLAKYEAREVARAKGDEGKVASLRDKLATIDVFIAEAGPEGTVDDVKREILGLFGDGGGEFSGVTLSTVHKAKGLEWDRVFILDASEYMPIPWARMDWERQQEDNLCYVAATRAKRELRYISSEGLL